MISSSSRMIALFTIAVYFAVCVNGFQYQVNKSLEDLYIQKYKPGKAVKWEALTKMGPEGREALCRAVHEKTGFGVLPEDGLKETTVQNAFLKFSDPKLKNTYTQVLGCKKNNAEQYVYYLAQALDKDTVMLVFPTQDKKVKGKNIFAFTRRDQITDIPILKMFVGNGVTEKTATAQPAVASH